MDKRTTEYKIAKLADDARAAGWSVEYEGSVVWIVRRHRRTGKVIEGVYIYQDGSAFLADVDLDCTRQMSLPVARKILRLA